MQRIHIGGYAMGVSLWAPALAAAGPTAVNAH